MNHADTVQEVCRYAREDAEKKLEKVAYYAEVYADSLRAEAGLRDRRPEWVAWARKHATQVLAAAKKLSDLLDEPSP